MQEKDMYTLQELYDSLEVPYSKLSKIADMSEGTVTRIRDGYPARRTTLNRLLRAFSEVYGIKITLEHVTGVQIEDKRASQKDEKPTADALPIADITQPEKSPIRSVEPKKGKRAYKERDTGLPDGCILASKFAEAHNVKRRTFLDHMDNGLGPGLIGTSTDTIPQRDQVAYSERDHPSRKGEKERYLTQEQQAAALDFWRRHGIEFRMPESEEKERTPR